MLSEAYNGSQIGIDFDALIFVPSLSEAREGYAGVRFGIFSDGLRWQGCD